MPLPPSHRRSSIVKRNTLHEKEHPELVENEKDPEYGEDDDRRDS